MKVIFALVLASALASALAVAGNFADYEHAQSMRGEFFGMPKGEAKKAKYKEIMAAYEKSMQAHPQDTNSVRGAAEIAFEYTDFGKAAQLYYKLLELHPTACDVHPRLGLISLGGNNLDGARQHLAKERDVCPRTPFWKKLKADLEAANAKKK